MKAAKKGLKNKKPRNKKEIYKYPINQQFIRTDKRIGYYIYYDLEI